MQQIYILICSDNILKEFPWSCIWSFLAEGFRLGWPEYKITVCTEVFGLQKIFQPPPIERRRPICLQSHEPRDKNNDAMEMGSCQEKEKEVKAWRRSEWSFQEK